MPVIAKVSQGFAAGLIGWSTPPWTAITDLPQNLQESKIKGLFSVSLPAFSSIYIVADFFPKERTSCEAGFDSPIFPLLHFSFISGITGLLYIQGRLHKNAMCIHDHTLSILQTWWQTDKAKPHIFELTWMLLPQVAHREWVTAFASRRTSAMETSKIALFSFPS